MAEILPKHDTSERSCFIKAPGEKKIPWGLCHQDLQKFAATDGLFFAGKKLAPDFFGRSTLTYEITPQGSLHSIRVKIQSGSRSFYLDECSWVCPGPPLLFVYGIAFKAAKEYIPPLWLWKLFEGPLLLESEHFQRFTKSCIDPLDPDLPGVEGCISPIVQQLPLPTLALRDRVGATASLYLLVEGKKILFDRMMPKNFLSSAQEWEKDLLETNFRKQSTAENGYYCPIDKVGKSIGFLLECGWSIEDYLGREVIKSTDTAIIGHSENNTVLIRGGMQFGEYACKLDELVGAFNRRETFVQLSANRVGLLSDSESIITLAAAAAEGEICSDNTIRISKNRLGSLGEKLEEIQGLENLSSLLSSAAHNFTTLLPAPAATSFCGHLRPYQQAGVDWLQFLMDSNFGGILADDMGLGKTVQILAFLSRQEKTPSLIVVPRSLLFNWKREIEQFLPKASVVIHHGIDRTQESVTFEQYDIVLTSYGILRRDQPLLSKISWQCLILDEAQTIKNPDSGSAKAACLLKARLSVAVSGTPIENNLLELWSLFHFALPGLLQNRKAFSSEILAAESDSRYLQRLKKTVRPFILRRTKKIAAPDLPEKIEQTIWVELSDSQRIKYEAFLSGARKGLLKKITADGAKKHRMEILETLLRLRQICCHPLLVDSEDANATSAKLDALFTDLENVHAEGHKALIYSQFTSMLSLIKKGMHERGFRYSYLDGSTYDREKAVEEFQANPEIPFFLISLKAGGTGLNLTKADYVFLFDPWWNRAAEHQAIDRAHRIGRTEKVIARRYVAANTVEEKMLRLSEKKSALSDALIGDGTLAELITTEDLFFLLN